MSMNRDAKSYLRLPRRSKPPWWVSWGLDDPHAFCYPTVIAVQVRCVCELARRRLGRRFFLGRSLSTYKCLFDHVRPKWPAYRSRWDTSQMIVDTSKGRPQFRYQYKPGFLVCIVLTCWKHQGTRNIFEFETVVDGYFYVNLPLILGSKVLWEGSVQGPSWNRLLSPLKQEIYVEC